ncbi:MAG: hypothetical protein R3F20_08655 [Planctomycetota bacterium]
MKKITATTALALLSAVLAVGPGSAAPSRQETPQKAEVTGRLRDMERQADIMQRVIAKVLDRDRDQLLGVETKGGLDDVTGEEEARKPSRRIDDPNPLAGVHGKVSTAEGEFLAATNLARFGIRRSGATVVLPDYGTVSTFSLRVPVVVETRTEDDGAADDLWEETRREKDTPFDWDGRAARAKILRIDDAVVTRTIDAILETLAANARHLRAYEGKDRYSISIEFVGENHGFQGVPSIRVVMQPTKDALLRAAAGRQAATVLRRDDIRLTRF